MKSSSHYTPTAIEGFFISFLFFFFFNPITVYTKWYFSLSPPHPTASAFNMTREHQRVGRGRILPFVPCNPPLIQFQSPVWLRWIHSLFKQQQQNQYQLPELLQFDEQYGCKAKLSSCSKTGEKLALREWHRPWTQNKNWWHFCTEHVSLFSTQRFSRQIP